MSKPGKPQEKALKSEWKGVLNMGKRLKRRKSKNGRIEGCYQHIEPIRLKAEYLL